jgi:hypothetical protein
LQTATLLELGVRINWAWIFPREQISVPLLKPIPVGPVIAQMAKIKKLLANSGAGFKPKKFSGAV